MGLIDKAVAQEGMTLDREVPVPGQRRLKDWARLIGTARRLEAADHEELEVERRRTRALETEVNQLQKKSTLDMLRREFQTLRECQGQCDRLSR